MPGVKDAVRRNAFLATVVSWWRDQRLAGRSGALGEPDQAELVRMALELGLTRRDIELLAAEGAYADDLMRRMLVSHAISALDLAENRPDLYGELARRCAECSVKGRCEQELAAGTAASNAEQFCPNASAIRGLAM